MDRSAANPVFICGIFILRCLVPLILMLGISYLLRRFGFVTEPPVEPNETSDNDNNPLSNYGGDLRHDQV